MTSIKEIMFQLPIDLERMIYEFTQDKEQMDKVIHEINILNSKKKMDICVEHIKLLTYEYNYILPKIHPYIRYTYNNITKYLVNWGCSQGYDTIVRTNVNYSESESESESEYE
jgi:hypothetical protein